MDVKVVMQRDSPENASETTWVLPFVIRDKKGESMNVMMIDEILFTSMWLDEIEMNICCQWFHDVDLCVEMMIKIYEVWIMHYSL